MNKWEYKIVSVHAKRNFWTRQFDLKVVEDKLNSMGQQGWELVAMEGLSARHAISPVLTFKRAI
ncbi:DUF4177 domain-containing protein [Undibacterium sp. RTI2.1]|uniref:DUF4177 domain-containing protein n=1 Tax=unclassified Undibacterium TaxID=2630295 RepID=UPI002AB37044|nr:MULTISPECIES: DUF4177 domain-containing protein [unclassified Undibacterium]MDY7539073.1 DUF4177 domain-containing protein [Undibacterium sp. 5I1]MEB0031002.1 DUF4177 domain-containing protein [Undibacterium sp. RTI2.1]MEB0115849.1 DUF4177 domain-containing protein [Undibacterium sp. RTI2.2]MEB0229793.1 DUF4177 domain-containing protein [Undibacterium sp. 10I3]MEB0258302.1 DUF4177 domain-containing protein [Undibacterium sp. 5I1]